MFPQESEIRTYCYLVERGKPTALVTIQDRFINSALSVVEKENLYAYIEYLSEGWSTFWIYKYEYMFEVIKSLPEEPKTVYEHWILGKVFGYSDEAIREFVN